MNRFALVFALLLALPFTGHAQNPSQTTLTPPAARTISAAGIRGHLAFLADDLLQGRAPGTAGGRLAARYIASQLTLIGLEQPRGGFRQGVAIDAWQPDTTRSSVSFVARGDTIGVALNADVIAWPGVADTLVNIGADVVFVGYGVRAPEYDWDDYERRDVKGKVVLILGGDPPTPPTEPALFEGRALTRYGRWTYKLEEARRQGAAGALIVHTDDSAGYPWNVVQSSFGEAQYTLADRRNQPAPLRVEGWIRVSTARSLLADAGHSLDELLASAARRDFQPVSTGITMRARIAGSARRIDTQNVVGMLPGREHADSFVVYTAHFDHLGIGPAVNGDSIYNGAYDNASGVAALLEIARAFRRLEQPPARSVVFLFTTAEEAGLLGSTQYVRTPAAPVANTIAAINIDGANLWGETHDFVLLGAESTPGIAGIADARGAEMNMRRTPDPAPWLGLYFRSDHFAFVQAGVPAVQLMHGEHYRGRPENWGIEMLARWNASSYHLPTDEYDPAMDLRGAVQQARLAFLIGYDVAERGVGNDSTTQRER
ncbi:MAG TPA: M20/M25/M40 family metallo-hydrolase [Longimicrobiales bacterium]|nr:M20/M25/M40 family metallo-hydrolase [Longimicrobiales bacterium]